MAVDLLLRHDTFIGNNHPTFIIAEIGQNHQGNIDTAKKLIEVAKECGADCVKLQKTCIVEKFNKKALQRRYIHQNSWGETYGEHKEYLEFTNEQFFELQKFASDIGILFAATPMDEVSLNFLQSLDVPFIKIGSSDCNNLQFIEKAAKTNITLIISTGMQDLDTVTRVYETVSKHHNKFCLLHTVSAYPTPIEEINLSVLKLYQEQFPTVNIGYSGHEVGIDVSVAAVAVGARVIERHITLGHNQKGSDHICSLEPCELKLMVQRIRTLEIALGKPVKKLQKSEFDCYSKLRKTLVLARSVSEGQILTRNDFKIKVAEPAGIDPINLDDVIGQVSVRNMDEDESLTQDCLKKENAHQPISP